MPRRPRVYLDGVPLHIVQRGNNGEPCFFREDDYLIYRHWLGEALSDADCWLHAYVLMTNHLHLLLTPKKAVAIPRRIISLRRRYVQYLNRTPRRSVTLWVVNRAVQVVGPPRFCVRGPRLPCHVPKLYSSLGLPQTSGPPRRLTNPLSCSRRIFTLAGSCIQQRGHSPETSGALGLT
jgi:REP element-mobilizing transposase RayT